MGFHQRSLNLGQPVAIPNAWNCLKGSQYNYQGAPGIMIGFDLFWPFGVDFESPELTIGYTVTLTWPYH